VPPESRPCWMRTLVVVFQLSIGISFMS
jgi:hypothetical protein